MALSEGLKPWTAHRPWKGKDCTIITEGEHKAHLYLAEGVDVPLWTVFEPSFATIGDEDGIGVHTDPRHGSHIERRYMAEGVMSGLEERRDHLPGRFVVCKAIGLAVHFGASSITLLGDLPPRAIRNLDTMRRPLKGRRVRLHEGFTP